MTKRIAIIQSNYVPWRGYFDLLASVDELVLLDDAQYTRRDWRNRNRIKTAQGVRWLSIAVRTKGGYHQAIRDTRIAEPRFAEAHWATIRQAYGRAAGFAAQGAFVEELYRTAPTELLSDVNRHFTAAIAARLGIVTPLTWSTDYDAAGASTERLLGICLAAGATEYITGPAARDYLDEGQFRRHGIDVTWFTYGPYAAYDQVHPPFEPAVSILDVLLCAGEDAPRLVRSLEGARR
jgi:WbqC-like protein family